MPRLGQAPRLPLFAVILAGGRGERLWPRVRRDRPKPFVPLFGRRTLFEATAARARALAGRDRVLVVCGADQARWVRRQAPWIPADRIVREAVGRNTAAAVALAALWVERRAGDGLLVVLPADHLVAPPGRFLRAVKRAARAVALRGGLAILGVPPSRPDTGFGYVAVGGPAGFPGVRRAAGFREKPSKTIAARWVRGRRHLWNCGIFVGRASTFLRELGRLAPRVLAPLRRAPVPRHGPWRVPGGVLARVPAIPFDRAVLERAGDLMVVPAAFRWSDLGTWPAIADALGGLRPEDEGRVLESGSARCAAFNPGGLTAFVEVQDLVLVREGNVVLVCRRDAPQAVRDIVAGLRGRLARHA
ncbi:MAG TPA: sugar phosphate nucleotidyltransferase [Candidatus Polarisedimenticolia bacterium]|nr:sugar phosphate nucleotidyltransferase [Candidatus Polarisedimenticolia bacterium]